MTVLRPKGTLMDRSSDANTVAVSRRSALKTGAFVGGAALWCAPTLGTVFLSATAAEATSGGTGTGGHTPLPPAPHGLPSHGFFVIKQAGKLYGFEILASGVVAAVASLGVGNDLAWLLRHGYAGQTIVRTGPAWDALKAHITVNQAKFPGTAVKVLVLSAWPGVLQGAWTWDGSFQTDADRDKVRNSVLLGGKYYFYK